MSFTTDVEVTHLDVALIGGQRWVVLDTAAGSRVLLRGMEERIDPAMPSRLQPSCNVPGRGVAYPPVRIARVAEAVERGGAHVTIRSICEEDFETSILEIIRQIRDSGAGG